MIAYASSTSSRNLEVLRYYGWRLIITPTSSRKKNPHQGIGYALDNGAWYAHVNKTEWDEAGFVDILERLGGEADWVAAPDIVQGGAESLELSLKWLRAIHEYVDLALIPVQDGMAMTDLDGVLSQDVGVFVGGSTEWKLSTMRDWCDLARRHNTWSHIGRVNSIKRINLCLSAGATSFDGSSASRWSVNTQKLDAARRQRTMFELWDE